MRLRKVESWVVYRRVIKGQTTEINAVCEAGEWEAMQAAQPGLLTLIRSGIACSCERCATSCLLHPPPVSAQYPVWSPGETWPTVIRSHCPVEPPAHDGHGSSPRALHDNTGSSTTLVPAGRS